jgi:PAS domain-containing protein
MQSLPPYDTVLDERLRLIVASFHRLTGKPLLQTVPADAAAFRAAVWNAPHAIVAHGTEADPVFFYGNRLALQLFEMSFEEFARLPSRLSAEPLARDERARLLEKVTRQGYVDDYTGMRISGSGRRFMITNGTVWNLTDEQGVHCGQAATFIV